MTLAFRAFIRAIFSTIKRWKIVVFFFLFNLVFGLLISLPMMADISAQGGHFGGLKGFIDAFDAEIHLDFMNARSAAGGSAAAGIGLWGLVYFLLFNAITAGAIVILADPRETTSLKTFFRAIGAYSFRFFRLLFYFALLLVLVALVNTQLNKIVLWFFIDVHELGASSTMLGWVMLAKNIFMAIVLAFALLSFNYAKYATVTEEGHFMGYYFFRGMGFTLAHPFATGIFFILSLIPFAAVMLLYTWASRVIDPHAEYKIMEGIVPFEWELSGAVCFIFTAQVIQLLIQACLFFRHAGQVNIFKRIMVLTAHPDPDLQKSVPESYFVVDRPSLEDSKVKAGKSGGGANAKSILLAALGFFLLSAGPDAAAQEAVRPATPTAAALSKRVAEYKIQAELDVETWSVDCWQSVSFENTTSKPTDELVFHLYANGHSNSRSVHQIGSKWAIDFNAADPAKLGYIDIKSVTLSDGSALPAPPVINDTIMRVPLPAALAPGARTGLNIEFRTKFPFKNFSRSGFIGRHLMATQWYPKLAVLEEGGWVASPYYPRSEYYAPFGVFDVAVTVPAAFQVEGSGSLMEVATSDDDELKTVRFHAADVHDFAWVADAKAKLPVPSTYGTTKVVNVVQPYARGKTDQINSVLKECLAIYEDWYMPYPYERIVVVGAPHYTWGGMEYPGLITISFKFPLTCGWITEATFDPAKVTVHEFTHQYFYGILASNENREPWLDEGLTTWSTSMVMNEIYGPGESAPFLDRMEKTILFEVLNQGFGLYGYKGPGARYGFLRSINLMSVIGYDESPFHDAKENTLLGYKIEDLNIAGFNNAKDIWMKKEYAPFAAADAPGKATVDMFPNSYHPLAYSKAALSLQTLENHIGRTKMKQLMRTYVERFKFRHPRTADFLGVVQEVAGPEYAGMLETLIRTPATVDFAVVRLENRPVKKPVGFITQKAPGDEIAYVDPAPEPEPAAEPAGPASTEGNEPVAAAEGDSTTAATESQGFEWDVIVVNRGQLQFPVDVELTFEGGRTVTRTFDGKQPFLRLTGKSPDKLVCAVVDPDHKFALDLNRINNARTAEYQRNEVHFLDGFVHFWTQNFLNGWAFFN